MTSSARVIIQCRLSSTRLPAKALLPIGGLPSAVLCARRAANTGLDVCVATSSDPSDDELARVLAANRIRCVRGPLDDVRQRYVQASADLGDGDRIVRLTADNVFPDGGFVGELVADAASRSAEYLGTHSPFDGLPYGMSAEAFTVGALRRAAAAGGDAFDREHVTPALRRPGPPPLFRPRSRLPDLAHLRCTMDSFEDYSRLVRVFDGIADPVAVGWRDLCERLASLDGAPQFRIPFRNKFGRACGIMTMGTAQLGIERYGAANLTGRPPRGTAVGMIEVAVRHGVTAIDCARAYDEAETVVGDAMSRLPRDAVTVITKLDPLAWLPADASDAGVSSAVEASVLRSCRELRTPRLDVLLLHRWAHRTSHGGAIWRTLKRLQEEGCIGLIGASVGSVTEAAEALADPDIRHLQIPFNLLDGRWQEAGIPDLIRRRGDITVHARSVMLQGLLAAPPSAWPRIPGVDAAAWVERIEQLSADLGRQGRADLCVAYAAAQPWIDSLVIGAETPEQLSANLDLCRRPPLQSDESCRVESALAGAPARLLNPSEW